MSVGALPTVADGFESFRRAVVPEAAPEVQVQECRRAFYAGAWNLYCALVVQVGEMSDVAAERYLEVLRDELLAFKASVGSPLEGLDVPRETGH